MEMVRVAIFRKIWDQSVLGTEGKRQRKKNERKWKANKETGESFTRELKSGKLLSDYIKFKTVKNSALLRCCDFCLNVYEFYHLLWITLAAFTVDCAEDCYGNG